MNWRSNNVMVMGVENFRNLTIFNLTFSAFLEIIGQKRFFYPQTDRS